MLRINIGEQIRVYDHCMKMLGQGAFFSQLTNPKANYVQYFCKKGSIVAHGQHIIEFGDKKFILPHENMGAFKKGDIVMTNENIKCASYLKGVIPKGTKLKITGDYDKMYGAETIDEFPTKIDMLISENCLESWCCRR